MLVEQPSFAQPQPPAGEDLTKRGLLPDVQASAKRFMESHFSQIANIFRPKKSRHEIVCGCFVAIICKVSPFHPLESFVGLQHQWVVHIYIFLLHEVALGLVTAGLEEEGRRLSDWRGSVDAMACHALGSRCGRRNRSGNQRPSCCPQCHVYSGCWCSLWAHRPTLTLASTCMCCT